jgi:hypothetical protein
MCTLADRYPVARQFLIPGDQNRVEKCSTLFALAARLLARASSVHLLCDAGGGVAWRELAVIAAACPAVEELTGEQAGGTCGEPSPMLLQQVRTWV